MLRILLYIVLVGLGTLFAILYTHYEIFLFVGVPVLFPIFSFVVSMIAGMLLKVTAHGENRQTYKGEEGKIWIDIQNKSIVPLRNCVLEYTYGYEIGSKPAKGKIKFHIRARGKCSLPLSLKGEYCGSVLLRMKKVRIQDYFGVFRFSRKVNVYYKQSIYPKLESLDLEVSQAVSFYNDEYDEFYEDHPGNDPSEVFEIREYREGDRLSRIHWKVSSKKDQYMVKEYSDPIIISAVVILDNSCSDKKLKRIQVWSDLLEKTLQTSYTLMINKVNHYVYWFDGQHTKGERREIKNEADFAAVMPYILNCRPCKDSADYCNYLLYSEQIENYANVFYIGEESKVMLEQNGVDLKVVE